MGLGFFDADYADERKGLTAESAKTAEKSKFKNKKYNSANSAVSAVKNRRAFRILLRGL
jgi:hypothetical protein